MSLIHDALKKAQDKERAPLGSGLASYQDDVVSPKPPLPVRTIILVAILVVALAVFAYLKFWGSKEEVASAPPVPIAGTGQPDAARLKQKAADAYGADDLDGAWESLSAANRLDEKDPEIWNNLGLVARKRGDLVKAREAYGKALELKPDYPEALNNLAVLSMQSGDTAKAQELLEKALKVQPTYPEANFHLALISEQKGEKAKAIEHYKRFLQVGSGLPSSVVDRVRDHVMEIEK